MGGKKFRFSLQSVLTLRTYEAEQAAQTLQQAAHARRRQEARVAQLHHTATARTVVLPAQGRLDPRRLRREAAFQRDAERALDAARRHLDVLEARERQARDALRQRHTAEASLQTLHDHERARHHDDQQAAEIDFLDEQALTGFHRARRP